MSTQKLPFVTDEVLYDQVKKVINIAQQAADRAESKLYDNVIDPFSAVFDSLRQGISLTDWLEQEKARQIQKTMQNAVGDFHQAILGNVDGWVDLQVGGVVDLLSDERRIIAEVKNKHNTTKGNHKKNIYDDLHNLINMTYKDYTGYYVEIIPKSKQPYDKPFTPSDNETKTRRPINERIRVIDGRSFYELVTGYPDALKKLYAVLPEVISEVTHNDFNPIVSDPIYTELFERAYPQK
jgi:hypothetical protein